MSSSDAGAEDVDHHDAEDLDLREGIASLNRLGSSRLSLEELLTRVANYAVQAIPGAGGAGLTLLEADRADTIVATAPFVSEIDDIQYGIGQGPCITRPPRVTPCCRDLWAPTRDGRSLAGGLRGSGYTVSCRCLCSPQTASSEQ